MKYKYSNLLQDFSKFSDSLDAYAISFIKKNIKKSSGHWIHIEYCKPFKKSEDFTQFKIVKGALFKRILKPDYPPEADFIVNGKFNKSEHSKIVRAITWRTANEDIQRQMNEKVKPIYFEVGSIFYIRKPKEYFISSAPSNIKFLAENLSDRTNPLWDIAIKYVNHPEDIYKIKNIRFY